MWLQCVCGADGWMLWAVCLGGNSSSVGLKHTADGWTADV